MSTIVLTHEPFYRRPPIRLLQASTGRIMVVGDDPATAGAIARALARCEVHRPRNSRDALRALSAADPFDGLFCDLSVAEAGSSAGAQAFYEALGHRHPALADQMVFIVDAGICVREHWFLGALENPVIEKPIDHDVVIELAWGGCDGEHETDGAPRTVNGVNGAGKYLL
jgi:hypothetical protein